MSVVDVDNKPYDELFYEYLSVTSTSWLRRLLTCLDHVGVNIIDIYKIFEDLLSLLSLVRSIYRITLTELIKVINKTYLLVIIDGDSRLVDILTYKATAELIT